MNSLRTRIFVMVAVVLGAATLASGLLSRRATLIEERQVVGRREMPALGWLSPELDRAYASGGWDAVRAALQKPARDAGLLLVIVDANGHAQGASAAGFSRVTVTRADAQGNISFVNDDNATRNRVEIRGAPTIAVHDSAGALAGRVYALPGDARPPSARQAFVPDWIVVIVATAVVALLVAFAQSARLLRPIGELTAAARRMREGDLDVRVRPAGDDEIARLGRAFNEMAERLAETERMKRQMVGDIAHELRSPLTNLRCGLESIQDGLVAADAARIDALHSETLLLQRLIGDLQDLALAESGGLTLHLDSVDVAAVARRAIGDETTRPVVSLHVDADAAAVRADAVRLEQMVRNLVTNARQHTPAGGRIEVRAERHDSRVRLAVADTGRGIAAEHLPRVFDRFYRVDGSRDRATGGAGLGLAIVRRLAEAQGGTVSASSPGEGHGAVFTIDLPAAV